MDKDRMPDWPPQASAIGRPDGEIGHGSTGQRFYVKDGRWVRYEEMKVVRPDSNGDGK